MDTTFRSAASRINHVVGPMVMLIGIGAAVAALVLSLVLGHAGYLALFLPAVLALCAGALILRGARRSRLRLDAEGFRWAGFFGPERIVRWEHLQHIEPPEPDDAMLVAIARMHDGSAVPVRAVWEPSTVPSSVRPGPDRATVHHALVTAHQHWMARRR